MVIPKIQLAQTVIKLCELKGIKHIIISPGSRNAPLTIGFTNHTFFKCYSIVDERCAAFFALGIAQQTQEPVALVCTSGSALLNYFPAVAEAYYSDIPLVVLSADRPKHLVGIGDGQTINQKEIYGNHVLYSANLKLDINTEDDNQDELPIFKNIENKLEKLLGLQQSIQQENESEINKAINKAIVGKGPVHINVPFEEPLYETIDDFSVNPTVVSPEFSDAKTNPEAIDALVSVWNNASKKMILVGVNQPNTIEQKWLNVLAEQDDVIVFTETTSNLHHDHFFPSIDKLIAPLNEEQLKALQPDILLTFGGLIVSKKVKAFLRTYKPNEHWHVDQKKANDTFFCLSKHLRGKANTFFLQFLPKIETHQNSYKSTFTALKHHRAQQHNAYLETIDFSDLKAFKHILSSVPDHSMLQVGNSSAIRYTQLFDLNKTLQVFCNRGTSGIDGSTSTAIGCSVANSKPTVFITGDLSFFYDSNALWNAYTPYNFRIIVLNNGGGGIFRILPGHKNTENFDTYFETTHQLSAKQLCKMYNYEYEMAHSETELNSVLESFYNTSQKPKLLEVFTPRKNNDTILLDYFKAIK